MENYVIFSNARSILELMLCNWNLTKLDILPLLSSDCRAWALKLSEHLKILICLCLHFVNSNLKVFFFIFHILHLHLIYVMNTIFHILTNVIKVVKIKFFRKVQLPMKPTEHYCLCPFHLQDPKPKGNHQIASSRAKTRLRPIQTCVKYRGNIFVLREIQMWTKGIWKDFTKKRPNRVDFPDTIFNFSKKKYMFFLPPYAWLESYGRHCSLGTNISGSLSFIPVLWVLSSRNTLNVTHQDLALYLKCFFVIDMYQKYNFI